MQIRETSIVTHGKSCGVEMKHKTCEEKTKFFSQLRRHLRSPGVKKLLKIPRRKKKRKTASKSNSEINPVKKTSTKLFHHRAMRKAAEKLQNSFRKHWNSDLMKKKRQNIIDYAVERHKFMIASKPCSLVELQLEAEQNRSQECNAFVSSQAKKTCTISTTHADQKRQGGNKSGKVATSKSPLDDQQNKSDSDDVSCKVVSSQHQCTSKHHCLDYSSSECSSPVASTSRSHSNKACSSDEDIHSIIYGSSSNVSLQTSPTKYVTIENKSKLCDSVDNPDRCEPATYSGNKKHWVENEPVVSSAKKLTPEIKPFHAKVKVSSTSCAIPDDLISFDSKTFRHADHLLKSFAKLKKTERNRSELQTEHLNKGRNLSCCSNDVRWRNPQHETLHHHQRSSSQSAELLWKLDDVAQKQKMSLSAEIYRTRANLIHEKSVDFVASDRWRPTSIPTRPHKRQFPELSDSDSDDDGIIAKMEEATRFPDFNMLSYRRQSSSFGTFTSRNLSCSNSNSYMVQQLSSSDSSPDIFYKKSFFR